MGFWIVKKGDDLIQKSMSEHMIMLPTKKEFNINSIVYKDKCRQIIDLLNRAEMLINNGCTTWHSDYKNLDL